MAGMGTDQKILNTLTKNLGINNDDELVLTKQLLVDAIRQADPWNSNKIVQESDFIGEDLPVDWGKLVEDNGSAVATVADEHTGVVRLTTGTDDNGKAAIHAQLNWMGDKNVIFECRVTIPSTITTYKLEIGLNDNLTAEAWGVLAEDGSGDASTDAIIFIWDTDKHATTLWVAGTKNGTGWGGVDTGVTMEAATTYDFRIVLTDDNAVMYYKKVGTHTAWQTLHTISDNSAITKTADLTPWIVCVARAISASRTLDVDRCRMEQER